jgi:hypothetical protein
MTFRAFYHLIVAFEEAFLTYIIKYFTEIIASAVFATEANSCNRFLEACITFEIVQVETMTEDR